MRNHQCHRCGKYVKRGIQSWINHNCIKNKYIIGVDPVSYDSKPQVFRINCGIKTLTLFEQTLNFYMNEEQFLERFKTFNSKENVLYLPVNTFLISNEIEYIKKHKIIVQLSLF